MSEQKDPMVVWSGKLATGGGKPEEFDAEMILVDGKPRLVRVSGISRTEAYPGRVRGDYWLPAFAALAKRVKELEASRIAIVSEGVLPSAVGAEDDCG